MPSACGETRGGLAGDNPRRSQSRAVPRCRPSRYHRLPMATELSSPPSKPTDLWARLRSRLESVGLLAARLLGQDENPFFIRQLRASRRALHPIIHEGIVVAVALAVATPGLALWALISRGAGPGPTFARQAWMSLAGVHIWAVLLVCYRAYTPLSGEHRSQTLELLLAAPLSSRDLLSGPAAFALLRAGVTSLSLLPIYLACLMMGGLTWIELFCLYAVFGGLCILSISQPAAALSAEALPGETKKPAADRGPTFTIPIIVALAVSALCFNPCCAALLLLLLLARRRTGGETPFIVWVAAAVGVAWVVGFIRASAVRGPAGLSAMLMLGLSWPGELSSTLAAPAGFYLWHWRPLYPFLFAVCGILALRLTAVALVRRPGPSPITYRRLQQLALVVLAWAVCGYLWPDLVLAGKAGSTLVGSKSLPACLTAFLFILAGAVAAFGAYEVWGTTLNPAYPEEREQPALLAALGRFLVALIMPLVIFLLCCLCGWVSPFSVFPPAAVKVLAFLAGAAALWAGFGAAAELSRKGGPIQGRLFWVVPWVVVYLVCMGWFAVHWPWRTVASSPSPVMSWLAAVPQGQKVTAGQVLPPWWLGPSLQGLVAVVLIYVTHVLARRHAVMVLAVARGRRIHLPAVREWLVRVMDRIRPNPVAALEIRRGWQTDWALLVFAGLCYLVTAALVIAYPQDSRAATIWMSPAFNPGPLAMFALVSLCWAGLTSFLAALTSPAVGIASQRQAQTLASVMVTPIRTPALLLGFILGRTASAVLILLPALAALITATLIAHRANSFFYGGLVVVYGFVALFCGASVGVLCGLSTRSPGTAAGIAIVGYFFWGIIKQQVWSMFAMFSFAVAGSAGAPALGGLPVLAVLMFSDAVAGVICLLIANARLEGLRAIGDAPPVKMVRVVRAG